MAKKKIEITPGLKNSPGTKLKKVRKEPEPKDVAVEQLHPKVDNKDSLTENIQSRSSKSAKGGKLGKIERVPLNQHLSVTPKKK